MSLYYWSWSVWLIILHFFGRKKFITGPLPSASALLSGRATASDGVVFNNPYKNAENAKIASLEKHVKMVRTFVRQLLDDFQSMKID